MGLYKKLQKKLRARRLKRRNKKLGGDIALAICLGIFGIFSAYPLIYIITNAFKPLNEVFLFPPKLFVENPTINNFFDLAAIVEMSRVIFSRYVFNTVFLTVVGTLLTVILGSMAAFPLAKYKFPGSGLMSNIIVYSLMFNSTVTAIPNYIIMSKLNMINTYWSIILPVVGSTLGLYLMKNFISQVPTTMLEAAKIDGANEFRIFWQIVMPICKPAWITLIILSFQTMWGTTGGVFIYSETLKPVSYMLSQIIGGGIARTGVASAVSVIMLVVPITVFVISQSNVLETMATSGLKD